MSDSGHDLPQRWREDLANDTENNREYVTTDTSDWTLHPTMETELMGMNKTVLNSDNQVKVFIETTSVLMNIIGILCILVNISFLIVMQFSKDGTSPFHKFMKNLSVSDVLGCIGFIVIQNWPMGPFASIQPSGGLILSKVLPYIFRGLPWMFFTSYFLTLTTLSINQYIAVCKPWKYSHLSSPRVITWSLVGIWLFSAFQVLIPSLVLLILSSVQQKQQALDRIYTISRIEMQVWMTIFIITTCVSIILNSLIYKKIQHLKWKRRLNMTLQESQNIRVKQDAFVTIILLLVSSVLLRLPFPVMSIITLEMGSSFPGQKAYYIINCVLLLLLYVNFFTDTMIYTIRVKEARRMYKTWCLKSTQCMRLNGHGFQSIPRQSAGRRSFGAVSKTTEGIELSSCSPEITNEKTRSIPAQNKPNDN